MKKAFCVFAALCAALVLGLGLAGCGSTDKSAVSNWRVVLDEDIRDMAVEADVTVFPQLGHFSRVNSVAFSPDGKQILSGADEVKLWDVASGREIRSFGHSQVRSVAFSPDGKQMLSGDSDGVKLWDVASGREIRSFKASWIRSVAFSPDGKHILSASWDNIVTLWDLASGQEIRSFQGHSHDVNSVAFSPDGQQIISGSADKTVRLWDVASGREIRSFKRHSDEVTSVAFGPDGKQILSGSKDKTVRLWDVASGRNIRSFKGREAYSVAFSPDGKQILSGSTYYMNLWDVASGREIRSFEGNSSRVNPVDFNTAYSVAFSSDGKQILSGYTDGTVRLWDVASGRNIRSFQGHSPAVSAVAFSPDGKQIISGGADKTVRLWDAANGQKIRSFQGDITVYSVAFSPDGKQILTGTQIGVWDSVMKLWDVASGQEIRSFQGQYGSVYSVAFSPDGKQILSGGSKTWASEATVKLWDVASGQEILSFHFDDVWSVAFSPDGKQILAGVYNEVHLCDVANGQEIRSFQVDRAAVSSVAFSPDGKQILAGVDSEVHLWDVASGQEIRSFQGQYGSVYSVAFSPDGKQILSGMKLWDAANGQEIRSFQGHSDRVSSVAFSPDGKQILSGSDDNTTRLWDAATGKELARFIGFSGSDTQITAATRDIAVEVVEEASSIEGEWLSITPDGYYNASPRGDRYVNVRVGDTVSGIDSYRSVFYNPEVVEARLNGLPDPDSKAVVTLQEATSFFPPTVTVQARDITTTANATSISVSVSDQNQPIKIIKIIVNGRLLGQDELSSVSGTQGLTAERTSLIVTDNLKEVAFNLPVTLDPGENLIEVMAFNGYTDTRQNTSVTWQTNQRLPPPNLWILAIGVNQYDDPGIQSLNYCVADAQGIIASFKAQEGKRYAKVNTLLIADNAPITPTVKNIRENLTWLDQAGPRDVILLFLAGHGITEGKNFYFVPKDGALKTRTSIDTTKAISDTDILSVLDAPGNRLIFIDACHSGGVDANRMTRALMESNGLVFTASQGDERSTEFADLDRGHGIFTYSIMQGLSGRYNTGRQKDIKILPLSVSVANFVSQEVERRTRDTNDPRTQHPKVYSLGFPDLTIALTN